jgi:hypothetical protein
MYLAWFDADRKKPVTEKIADARERYLAKFGAEPAVCLVNPADAVPGTPVELRPAAYISRNCFWIGVDEQEAPRQAPPEEPAIPAAPPAVPAVATEIAQRQDPAPTRKRKRSPKPAQPLGVLASEQAEPGTKPSRAVRRGVARQQPVDEMQVPAATPVAPTVLAPKGRKRAAVETKPATTPAVPTRDGGKSTTTVPVAGRAAKRAGVTAATGAVDSKATGGKPARTAESSGPAVPATPKSSKGKRQPAPSVIDSKKVATPVKAAARDKAAPPVAQGQPARIAKAPKSTPAKPRRLSESAKGSAATKAADAKPSTTTRARRERRAA